MNSLKRICMRRRFFVDIPFQRSLVWRTVGLSCFLLAAVLFGLLLPVLRDRQSAGANRAVAADAATVFLHLHRNLWWIVPLCLVLPALVALHVSHRIAGPLVRVKRMLEQLGRGELPPPLETRRGDYLKPEVALLNNAVARIGERMDRLRAAHQDLCRALAGARDCAGYDHGRALARAAAALGAELEAFGRGAAPGVPQPVQTALEPDPLTAGSTG